VGGFRNWHVLMILELDLFTVIFLVPTNHNTQHAYHFFC
jgi:hypothetical protein